MHSDSLLQLSLDQFNNISHDCMVKMDSKVTSTYSILLLLVTDTFLHSPVNSNGSS